MYESVCCQGEDLCCYLFLSGALFRGRGGRGWLGDRLLRFSFLWFLALRPGLALDFVSS